MSVQFGKRCKTLRHQKGLTQQQVADALGISRSAYAYYEIGGSEPSLEVLWELIQYFQVTAETLLNPAEC